MKLESEPLIEVMSLTSRTPPPRRPGMPESPRRAAGRRVSGAAADRRLACAVLLGASLVIAGCGGSGTGETPQAAAGIEARQPESGPQDTTHPPDPECVTLHDGTCASAQDFDARADELAREHAAHSQYANQWGLASIGADRAYAHVDLLEGKDAPPGAGVTVGFIDTGIDQDHPMVSEALVSEVFLLDAEDETGEENSHGTAVASIAAGVRGLPFDFLPHGVAWGADIAMFAIPLGEGDGTYDPIPLEDLADDDADSARLYNQVLTWSDGERRVDVLNLSFGYQGLIDGYSESELRASVPKSIEALAQAGAGDKAILVWAAGNSNSDSCDPSVPNCETGALDAVSPSVLAGLAARIPELRGHTVAVVALAPVDEIPLKPSDETLASFSNRCGLAADFCIAAPGQDVAFAYFGPDPVTSQPSRNVDSGAGTSFAAPMVSGGFAIMKQLFRDQLSSEELVTRLLETADDTGVFSDRDVYGRGKLDLAAATHPVGVLEVPVGPSANGAGINLRATHLRLGAPFGSGLGLSVLSHEVMALDDLGAPFWYRVGDFVASASGPSLNAVMRGFLADSPDRAPWRPGAWTRLTSAETEGGHLSLVEGGTMATFATAPGLSTSVFASGPRNREHGASGGALGWRPRSAPVAVRVGWIAEDEALLGGRAQGAFGSLSADTVFARVEGDVQLGRWRLGAGAELGRVRPRARGGLIEDISSLTTSAFALRARAPLANEDTVTVSLSQPLRVESGRASLTLPVARTKHGRVLSTSAESTLAPEERQLDVAVTWEKALQGGPLRLGLIWSHHPDHRDTAEPRLALLAGWRRAF